jgi:transcriptional regulator with PAS, ATPase and Fis domain
MREIRSLLEQIGETDVTVLIQGESGVGKEVVSREVHAVSNRSKEAFVKVNCAALPTDLLESELFGYERVPSRGPPVASAENSSKRIVERSF